VKDPQTLSRGIGGLFHGVELLSPEGCSLPPGGPRAPPGEIGIPWTSGIGTDNERGQRRQSETATCLSDLTKGGIELATAVGNELELFGSVAQLRGQLGVGDARVCQR
jgi:hypothetical protein